MNNNSYESPFCTRYASKEMQYIFSADKKFTTWRRLWVALARAEMKLGLNVTQEQVDELEANIENIDYEMAAKEEKIVRRVPLADEGLPFGAGEKHHPAVEPVPEIGPVRLRPGQFLRQGPVIDPNHLSK